MSNINAAVELLNKRAQSANAAVKMLLDVPRLRQEINRVKERGLFVAVYDGVPLLNYGWGRRCGLPYKTASNARRAAEQILGKDEVKFLEAVGLLKIVNLKIS